MASPFFAPASSAQNPIADACRNQEDGLERLTGRHSPACHGFGASSNATANVCRHASGQAGCNTLDGYAYSRAKVDAYLQSETHAQFMRLRHREDHLQLRETVWFSTHNSFHSSFYAPTLSGLDPNQRYSIRDQLDMDARAIEIDIHWMPRPDGDLGAVVCHGNGTAGPFNQNHLGCTIERDLTDVLPEIRDWLLEHPREIIVVYVDAYLGVFDQDKTRAEKEAVRIVNSTLGELLLRPSDQGARCEDGLPLDITRNEMRAKSRRLILASRCGTGGEWSSLVHSFQRNWTEQAYPLPGTDTCGWAPETYAASWTRIWEDATVLSDILTSRNQFEAKPSMMPVNESVLRTLVGCGINMASLDFLAPEDPRLEAFVDAWQSKLPRARNSEPSRSETPPDGEKQLINAPSGGDGGDQSAALQEQKPAAHARPIPSPIGSIPVALIAVILVRRLRAI